MDEVVVWLIYHHHTDQSYYMCYNTVIQSESRTEIIVKHVANQNIQEVHLTIARVWEMTAKLETYQELCYPN